MSRQDNYNNNNEHHYYDINNRFYYALDYNVSYNYTNNIFFYNNQINHNDDNK